MTISEQIIPMRRWWIYQQQRFPLAAHGVLIAVFVWSTTGYTALICGGHPPVGIVTEIMVFTVVLGFFMQLRIADEFKDAADDARYRPYRPVPSGMVTLRELRVIAVLTALIQLMLTLALDLRLILILLAVWIWMGLMTMEFGCAPWLRRHPIIYLISHMAIMPFITFYATACYWVPAGVIPGIYLLPLFVISFSTGLVFEIGRKIRTPAEEETGVETYSALWGQRGAIYVWWASIAVSLACANVIGLRLHSIILTSTLVAAITVYGLVSGWRLLRDPLACGGASIKTASGLIMLAIYIHVGLAAGLYTLDVIPR